MWEYLTLQNHTLKSFKLQILLYAFYYSTTGTYTQIFQILNFVMCILLQYIFKKC